MKLKFKKELKIGFREKLIMKISEYLQFIGSSDLIIYSENSSFFLDIIGRIEAFSENRFQVSGVSKKGSKVQG
jgi:hypothetical protein